MCRLRCSLVLVRLGRFISRKRLPLSLIRRSHCVGVPGVVQGRPLTSMGKMTVTWPVYCPERCFGFRILRLRGNVHFTSLPINSQKGPLVTRPLSTALVSLPPSGDWNPPYRRTKRDTEIPRKLEQNRSLKPEEMSHENEAKLTHRSDFHARSPKLGRYAKRQMHQQQGQILRKSAVQSAHQAL